MSSSSKKSLTNGVLVLKFPSDIMKGDVRIDERVSLRQCQRFEVRKLVGRSVECQKNSCEKNRINHLFYSFYTSLGLSLTNLNLKSTSNTKSCQHDAAVFPAVLFIRIFTFSFQVASRKQKKQQRAFFRLFSRD